MSNSRFLQLAFLSLIQRRQYGAIINHFLVLAIFAIPAPHLNADEEWTQFRGPRGDGSTTQKSLPRTWSETENVTWYTPIPGLGWSSPVIAGNRIYLTSSVASDPSSDKALQSPQELRLICLDIKTGKIDFVRELVEQGKDAPSIHAKNSHASPTPVVEGDRLFLHFGHQGTFCTDLEGQVIWSNRDHAYPPVHGNGASPIIVDNLLVVTCDGSSDPYTLALDKRTGKEVWRTGRVIDSPRKFSFSTPSLIEVNDAKQIISVGSDIVQAITPSSGEVLWWFRFDGYSVIPKPLYHEGTVFLSTGYGSTILLAIDPTGQGDVTETHLKWKYKSQTVPQTPSLLGFGNQIVMVGDNGVAMGFTADKGKELWKKRLGGNFSASPLLAGDMAYFQSEEGDATLLELSNDGKPPKEIAKNHLPSRTFASYAVVGNDLLIRNEEGIYRIHP